MQQQYDVVVVGAGSGGLTAAVGFAKTGKTVLLVEREHMGGECTNTGCIPSKALLHHAREYHIAKHIAGNTADTETYRQAAFTSVRETIDHILADETPETFKQMGIDVILGEASFQSQCTIAVGETTFTYKTAVIATGSSPRMIEVPGLSETDILTNQNIFALETIPEKTLIIGAGPIGLEMGQALAMLGSQVTIATIDTEFARLEDVALRPILKKSFTDLGITIHLNAFINRAEEQTAIFDIKNDTQIVGEERVEFDRVLIAVGRVPNLPPGLKEAGITSNEHGILVDSQHRTSNTYVYAVGDVAHTLKFTHTADDTARQVVARVVSKGLLRVNKNKAVPKVTYTTPEVAQVGMSWPDAVAKYTEERLMRIEVPFTGNDRAKTDRVTDGKLVVIARRINGAVLGAHIAGPAAGEMITFFTLAIDEKISLWKFQKLIFAYPTYSLIVKKAADQFVGRQLSALKTDLLHMLRRAAPKLALGFTWALALFFLYRYQSAHGMSVSQTALMVFDFISLTIWGPLLYILAYTVRPLTFFPGTALTILSGVFFGLGGGIFYTIIAANLSAAVAYGVGRFFGKNLQLEDSAIGNWVQALQKNPFAAVLTTRLIFLPFDGVSYAAGILKIPFVSFALATLIGTLLGIATFVAIGASLDVEAFANNGFSFDVIDAKFIGISLAVFIVSLGLSHLLKRWKAEQ